MQRNATLKLKRSLIKHLFFPLFSFMDALDGVPIPKMIQNYLQQYRQAIDQGKVQPAVDCGKTFKCKFSIKEVWTKAATKKKAF